MALPGECLPAPVQPEACDQQAYPEALHRAMQLLAGRPHSCRELLGKLYARGFDSRSAGAAVNRLVELGWLDDAAFAEGRLAWLLATGRSARLAREDLLSKGVPGEVVDNVLNSAAPPGSEEQRALIVARRRAARCAHLPLDRAMSRIFRHLCSKGYGSDVARKVSLTACQDLRHPDGSEPFYG